MDPKWKGLPPEDPRFSAPPGLETSRTPVEVDNFEVNRPGRAVEVSNADKAESSTRNDGMREVWITWDSGAGDFVCGSDDFPEFAVRESAAGKAGIWYTGPNRSIIDNKGEKQVRVTAGDFTELDSIWQIGDNVKKPLDSAGQAAKAGFASWLDEPTAESYVIHKKTQKKIPLKWVNGVYKMRAWVKAPGFTRQGKK